ncbi:class II fructose-1,6-bisphosphate aldolase [Candidatus Bathyarchaeota archaeon]|nr:class II fructose-1,6-bisphosphate aldolase [Candidatus Bathyarchaeota archaeon]NIU81323.1 class II fructose-1,6-bisphosphate aldolase [Candidatus Bathyarchaeota archaeon]NIV67965.1 class II fructose-1,6-bisphosphate aldolase [Candidatus Bathyarchaeota archaeon]NIW16411.1 class II fructose-1,6-bisphosphate aldolase [Candidatus Bathyarchaeota archaeon]NIW35009.1 class II fructose-1,6-bisphosphate aldolase [Candidatus Bathyarchaeota archaeon]
MLVTNREILTSARAGKYAVGAFNIQNLESFQAVSEAAQEEDSPVIVAVTPSSIKYASLASLAKLVKTVCQNASVPMSLHLDHGKDIEVVTDCLDAGFTSVMIDGSHLNFDDNVALTEKVVGLAHVRDISVEAELGRLAGIEEASFEEKEAILTDPEAAKKFVEETEVDALAVAIGTSHGAYKFKGKPKLDFARLEEIGERVDIPLVLHGASGVPTHIVEKATKYGAQLPGAKGVPDKSIKKAVRRGIAKINIDTDLRLAFTATVREVLATVPEQFDPRKILGPAREAMKEVVRGKMRLFGSSNKA